MNKNTEQQQPVPQSQSSTIIGSYLSIITKAQSRYEGTLVEVDKVKKTMSLKNVRNMGTEGRRDGENELPATDAILGQVKFRVDLIKTFEIIEKPKEEAADEGGDPAIISSEPEVKEERKPAKQPRHTDDWSKGTKINRRKDDE